MRFRWSNILLTVGLVLLLVGAVLSMLKQQCADYLLVAGAVVIVFRGALRSRERLDSDNNQ